MLRMCSRDATMLYDAAKTELDHDWKSLKIVAENETALDTWRAGC